MSEEIMAGTSQPPAEERTVDVVTLEIMTLKRQAGQILMGYAIEIGRRLAEVKELLSHGEWGSYLKTRVEYSQSTADNFMRLFREYGESQYSLFGAEANSQTIANLPYSKALALLALPEDEREDFARDNDVENMSTRELKEAIRAKEEAQADAKTAEEARARMEADMKAANDLLTAANREAEEARRAREEAEERERALKDRLEELENRPVDVAVEAPDPDKLTEAREEGRREAEEALREKADAAEREKAEAVRKAKEELAAARERAREAEEAGKRAEEALLEAQEEAQRLKKSLEAAGSKDLAAFQVYFENAQKDFAKMLDCLKKLEQAGDAEHHDKLVGALGALVEALKGQVPGKAGS